MSAMNAWAANSLSSSRSPTAKNNTEFRAKAHMNFMETLGRNRAKNNRTANDKPFFTKRNDTFDKSFINDEDDMPRDNRRKIHVHRLNDRCTSSNALNIGRAGQPSPMLDRRPTVQREMIQRPLVMNARFYADSGLSMYATAQAGFVDHTLPQKSGNANAAASASK